MYVGANLPTAKEGYLKESLPVHGPFPPTAVVACFFVSGLTFGTRHLCRLICFFFACRRIGSDRDGFRNDTQSRAHGSVSIAGGQDVSAFNAFRVLLRTEVTDHLLPFRRARLTRCRQDDAGDNGQFILNNRVRGRSARSFVFVGHDYSQRSSKRRRGFNVGRVAVVRISIAGGECVVYACCGFVQYGKCSFRVRSTAS